MFICDLNILHHALKIQISSSIQINEKKQLVTDSNDVYIDFFVIKNYVYLTKRKKNKKPKKITQFIISVHTKLINNNNFENILITIRTIAINKLLTLYIYLYKSLLSAA